MGHTPLLKRQHDFLWLHYSWVNVKIIPFSSGSWHNYNFPNCFSMLPTQFPISIRKILKTSGFVQFFSRKCYYKPIYVELKSQILSTCLTVTVAKCYYILDNNIPLHFKKSSLEHWWRAYRKLHFILSKIKNVLFQRLTANQVTTQKLSSTEVCS